MNIFALPADVIYVFCIAFLEIIAISVEYPRVGF